MSSIVNIPIGSGLPFDPLENSRLTPTPQLEAMGVDVDIASFNLQIERLGGIQLRTAITDASISRTIEGASTLTITVNDDLERTIEQSGRLGRQVWVNLDGLWFALVGVTKNGRSIDLKFEDREVNLLRYYKSFIKADRATTTRAEFVLRMIEEVNQVKLEWVIPELHDKQQIGDGLGPNQTLVDSSGQVISSGATLNKINGAQDQTIRQQGIPYGPAPIDLTVKRATATKEQIDNANTILRVGISKGARPKVLVAAIQTAITESRILNSQGKIVKGHKIDVGIFQQNSLYWPATGNTVIDASAWFDSAIAYDKQYPNLSYAMLCQGVQHSRFTDGSNYAPWQAEAEKFVNEFGQAVPTSSKDPTGNNQALPTVTNGGAQYFIRGKLSQAGSNTAMYIYEPQTSWDCMQSLANDVNWRCFVVSGKVYFISEAWLFRSKPFMTINEEVDGIDWINYDYDEGKKVATITVTAHLSRWSAPPGSIVKIKGQSNIIDGRYLVNTVTRSLFESIATITLKKPLPVLPEPSTIAGIPKGFLGSDTQQAADSAANAIARSTANSFDLIWPLPTKDTSQYRRVDQGWDLQGTSGTPIYSIAAGTVSVANRNPGGFGNDYPILSLDKDIGGPSKLIYYGHVHVLQSVVGQHVNAGQLIAHANVAYGENGSAAPPGWLEIGFGGSSPVGGDAGQIMHDTLINAQPLSNSVGR